MARRVEVQRHVSVAFRAARLLFDACVELRHIVGLVAAELSSGETVNFLRSHPEQGVVEKHDGLLAAVVYVEILFLNTSDEAF